MSSESEAADARDRINAALVAGSDAARSEADRQASLKTWSESVDMLPDMEHRRTFTEAAMTYAATLPSPCCESVRQKAQEKLSRLKPLTANSITK